jgi:hypothetical protein
MSDILTLFETGSRDLHNRVNKGVSNHGYFCLGEFRNLFDRLEDRSVAINEAKTLQSSNNSPSDTRAMKIYTKDSCGEIR